jgi:uncharacterized protein YutE (UPF0331/DUF86 family)
VSSPEAEILSDVSKRIEMLLSSLSDALEFAGVAPKTSDEFAQKTKLQKLASTALIKSIEQLEDQLARLFRTILMALAVDSHGWYAQDVANQMAQLGIVAEADDWVRVIKLRNRLVHDYPLDADAQMEKLTSAYWAASMMQESAARAFKFIAERHLID